MTDTIDGAGVLDLFNGTLDGSTVSTVTADLQSVRIVENVNVTSANVTAFFLNLASGADLSFTNPSAILNLNSSDIAGLGEVNIKGDDSVYLSGNLILIGATLDNFGNTTFGGSPNQSSPPVDVLMYKGAVIVNSSGATWTDEASGSQFLAQNGATATFINDGTFVEIGQGTLTLTL